MKKQKIATVVTCCALVGAVAVGGTLALVTSTAKTMTNTFTVGNGYETGDFKLYENGVDLIASDAVATSKHRNVGDYVLNSTVKKDADAIAADEKGNTYGSVIPGATLDKNPWFELDGTTAPESWVVARVKVEDLSKLETAGITIDNVGEGNKWHVVSWSTDNNAWVYGTAVSKDSFDTEKASGNIKDGYLYFVYENTIDTVTSNSVPNKTDSLFTKLKAADTNLGKITSSPLAIQGVAVQKLEGTTLEGSLQTIMTDAITAMNAGASTVNE